MRVMKAEYMANLIQKSLLVLSVLIFYSQSVNAHNLHGKDGHYDTSVKPPLPPQSLFTIPDKHGSKLAMRRISPTFTGDEIAAFFRPFRKSVKVHWDGEYFYVESNGIPAHPMMTGIVSWQQQVPIPQPYYGRNAWQFPLFPKAASRPLSCKDNFFRGAIAIAVNGVPIFNPIKNDGRTDTFLAGELDQYGGHAGRADDYHYHIAPLHLQSYVGKNVPIAFALDGYPIYGLTEADGTAARNLDQFNGHKDSKGRYHYHSTKAYPYVNGGFHGEVTVGGGQVEPQPHATPLRPFTRPLPGAKITGFTRDSKGVTTLTYEYRGGICKIRYAKQPDGKYRFEFLSASGKRTVKIYDPEDADRPPPRDHRPDSHRQDRRPPRGQRPDRRPPRPPGRFDDRPGQNDLNTMRTDDAR